MSGRIRRRGRPRQHFSPLSNILDERGITLRQLALLCSVTRGTTQRWCASALIPSPQQRARIAGVLGVPQASLWPGEGGEGNA